MRKLGDSAIIKACGLLAMFVSFVAIISLPASSALGQYYNVDDAADVDNIANFDATNNSNDVSSTEIEENYDKYKIFNRANNFDDFEYEIPLASNYYTINYSPEIQLYPSAPFVYSEAYPDNYYWQYWWYQPYRRYHRQYRYYRRRPYYYHPYIYFPYFPNYLTDHPTYYKYNHYTKPSARMRVFTPNNVIRPTIRTYPSYSVNKSSSFNTQRIIKNNASIRKSQRRVNIASIRTDASAIRRITRPRHINGRFSYVSRSGRARSYAVRSSAFKGSGRRSGRRGAHIHSNSGIQISGRSYKSTSGGSNRSRTVPIRRNAGTGSRSGRR